MSRLDAVKDAIGTQIAGFRPDTRTQVEQFFNELPDLLRDLGAALGTAAENMSDLHIHATVTEMLRELGHVVSGTAETAADTYASHTREHSLWLTD